jgi:hypothetical protein
MLSVWMLKVAVVALLMVPLLAIIVLALPVWLYLPFRESGREFILKLVREFTNWVRALKGVA